jgi:hypothetical protein
MEDILSKALFDVSIQLVLGDDDIFLFYTDPWLGGGGARLADLALDMVAVVASASRTRRTVASMLVD